MNEHTARLEELRQELRAERISYGELIELAELAPFIDPGDVELLEAAGVPEFPESPFDRALAYARELGAEHGKNAASWVFDGNTPQDAYARVLKGIEDGDPEILDSLPAPDLSGQWADGLTGPQLVEAAVVHADDWTMSRADWVAYWAALEPFSEICDAYELAFDDAVTAELERAARYQLA